MNITQTKANKLMDSLAELTCNYYLGNYLCNMVDVDDEEELERFTEWVNTKEQFMIICDTLEISEIE